MGHSHPFPQKNSHQSFLCPHGNCASGPLLTCPGLVRSGPSSTKMPYPEIALLQVLVTRDMMTGPGSIPFYQGTWFWSTLQTWPSELGFAWLAAQVKLQQERLRQRCHRCSMPLRSFFADLSCGYDTHALQPSLAWSCKRSAPYTWEPRVLGSLVC